MTTRSAKLYQGEDKSPVHDYTDLMIWEESEFGTRAWQGEGSASSIVIRDPLGEQGNELLLPAGLSRKSLAAKNLFVVEVDSSTLYRGRVGIKNYSRDNQHVERYRQVECTLHDTNWDLDHIFVHQYVRPEETDQARAQGLIASYLSASPRATTALNGSNYISGSNLVTLPAQTYNRTSPLGVLREVSGTANKQFFVTGDAIGGGSLFYDGNDSTAYACTFTISDRESEVRAAPTTTFPPIWSVGPASTEDGSELASHIRLFYGTGEDQYVTASSAIVQSQYSHASETITDDTVTDAANAQSKANARLAHRQYEDKNYNVTIGPLTDAQVVLVKHGMTINIKARAIPDADDQLRLMRIVQCRYTTPIAGTWFAHLQLGRPWKMAPYGTGPTLVPKPPSAGTPEACPDTLIDDDFSDVGDWPGSVTSEFDVSDGGGRFLSLGSGPIFPHHNGSSAPAPHIPVVAGSSYEFAVRTAKRDVSGPTEACIIQWRADNGGSPSAGVLSTTALKTGSWANATWYDLGGTFEAPATAAWVTIGWSAILDGWYLSDIMVRGECTPAVPADTTQPISGTDNSTGTPGTYTPSDHLHVHGNVTTGGPHHNASDVTFTPTGTVAATNVQAAIAEVDAEKMTNPMTTIGDVIVGGAAGVAERLAIGGSNTIFKSTGASPLWSNTARLSYLDVEEHTPPNPPSPPATVLRIYGSNSRGYVKNSSGTVVELGGSGGDGGGDGGGAELDYTEFTSPVSPTATTEATANTVVTAGAVTFDGSTAVIIEFFAFTARATAAANADMSFWLYDGSSSIGRIGHLRSPTAANNWMPVPLKRRLTPSAASHTYSFRASVSSGTGSILAGVGGSGADVPGFIRITEA